VFFTPAILKRGNYPQIPQSLKLLNLDYSFVMK
jgi:hypothetical protein